MSVCVECGLPPLPRLLSDLDEAAADPAAKVEEAALGDDEAFLHNAACKDAEQGDAARKVGGSLVLPGGETICMKQAR